LASEKSFITDSEIDKQFINAHPPSKKSERANLQVGGPQV